MTHETMEIGSSVASLNEMGSGNAIPGPWKVEVILVSQSVPLLDGKTRNKRRRARKNEISFCFSSFFSSVD